MASRDGVGGFVYFIQADRTSLIKIGWSRNPTARLNALQASSPDRLNMLHFVVGDERFERFLHRKYAHARSHGEWFRPAPEIFSDIKCSGETRYASQFAGYGSLTLSDQTRRGAPRLWQHKNGYWYVLYGKRHRRRVSTGCSERDEAEKFLEVFTKAA